MGIYTCLLCGRNKFIKKTPHWCNKNYRKHGIEWKLNNEDMSKEKLKEVTREHLDNIGVNYVSEIEEKATIKETEIRRIAESFQKECHSMVSGATQRSTKDISYQDGTNAWLFYKLAQLSYEIKELRRNK